MFTGIALQFSEDLSVAEGVYKKALALAGPEQVHSVLSNLGNLYRQQKRFADAHAVYKKALELCPAYAPAANNLGLLYVAEGNWDLAIASFDRALASDPFLEAARSNKLKAEALAQIGKSDQVINGPTSTQPPDAAPVEVSQAETAAPEDTSVQPCPGGIQGDQPPQAGPATRYPEPESEQSVRLPVVTQQVLPSPQPSQPTSSVSLSHSSHQGTRSSQVSFPANLAGPQLVQPPSGPNHAPPAVASRAALVRQPPQREPFPLPSIS